MTKPTHHVATLSPWKTLLLGGLLGYLVAVFVHSSGHEDSQSRGRLTESKELLLEEASSVSSESHHEETQEATALDTTVTVIVLFLISLTIMFETVKETIEEAVDRVMEPVIEGLFGELTVLGFLSVCTFFVTKLGWFNQLSEKIFGEEEKEELLEVFEMVHYMVFFVMVFFVINVLVLVRGATAMKRTWWIYNRACRDDKYMAEMNAILALHTAAEEETTYLRYLCQELLPFRSSKRSLRSELGLFRGLRHEFVVERSLDPPFLPHDQNCVPDEFDFGRYLSICLCHELGHIVHLKIPTWIFLGGVTAVFYVIALFVENRLESFVWIWVCTGWLFFLLGSYFDFHLFKILEGMAAKLGDIGELHDGERVSLMPRSPSLPYWTRIDLEEYIRTGRGLLARLFLPTNSKVTRQDVLYWMERKGPKLYMIIFQVQMVFTAAYVSLLVLIMFPYMFVETEQSLPERMAFLVLSILPVCLLLGKYQMAAANLTMACSIGEHRRPGVISQVIREEKVSQIIRAMVTMLRLQQFASEGVGFHDSAENNKDSPDSTVVTAPPDSCLDLEEVGIQFEAPIQMGDESNRTAGGISTSTGRRRSSMFSSVEMDEIGQTFDAIDVSRSGLIETSDFGAVLKGLGVAATEESLKAMTAILDENGDGSICRYEFTQFYKNYVRVELDHEELKQLAKDMFHLIDADGNGQITLGEFKDVVDHFNVGFTVDDIGDLVNELDEEDNGMVGEHEFLKLLEKHRLLFEHVELPKLE
ncbi:Troponin C, isoform 1 [Seminavis robusta]|uniref:Calmodulin n=1 Tax=Seminavis robusta TaxID=568900 RepID=A0A9N8E224_9STRA|nr:Troponin C, isoform 1 [Seminavis robusta]|eukprot:Sro452_g145840.1 Troponin C, isoform 1 (758) ;mRNA; f:12707-15140